MATFDENGNYIKTEWKAGDKITASKLNKIEDSLEAINNNNISRHVEADARLDILEEQAAGQNEVTNERMEELNDLVLDTKDELDLALLQTNNRMNAMEEEFQESLDDIDSVITTSENMINNALNAMNNAIADGKADMEAMVAEVEGELGKKVNNFYGTNNVGKILMVGEDGYLVIDDAPAGPGGGSYPVVGTVDDDNVITLSSDELVDGLYTLRYSDGVEYKLIGTVLVGERIATSITASKGKTTYEIGETLTTNDIVVTAHFNDLTSEVVTGYTVDSSSVMMNAEGNYTIIITYESCTTSIPIAVMDMSVTGNLFVASTCTLGKRISSTGEIKDQPNTFLTDYIEIGNCMAIGGENIIHWQGFHMYGISSAEYSAAGLQPSDVGTYKGVGYYDATGTYLGQDSLYVTEKAYDSEGNFQLVLNASYSTATKIRIFGVTLPPATSVSALSNCKLTLNQLISEI